MEWTYNPEYGKLNTSGYTDLGWQGQPESRNELKHCREQGHKMKEHDNSLYSFRGTDVIYYCEECKILRHVDMSD